MILYSERDPSHKGHIMWYINKTPYTPVIKHSNGKSPFSIGNTSSKGSFSIAMLDYQRVWMVYLATFCWRDSHGMTSQKPSSWEVMLDARDFPFTFQVEIGLFFVVCWLFCLRCHCWLCWVGLGCVGCSWVISLLVGLGCVVLGWLVCWLGWVVLWLLCWLG